MAQKKSGPRKARATLTEERDARNDIDRCLRSVIVERGLTTYGLGKEAGVDPTAIARFLSDERDLRFQTAVRLARALGLRLVESGAKPKRTGGT